AELDTWYDLFAVADERGGRQRRHPRIAAGNRDIFALGAKHGRRREELMIEELPLRAALVIDRSLYLRAFAVHAGAPSGECVVAFARDIRVRQERAGRKR